MDVDPSDNDTVANSVPDSDDSDDRVSVIKWADKRVVSSESSDTETLEDSNDENSSDGVEISNVSECDSEEVEFIGEFPPATKTFDKTNLLPPFFQFAPWGQYCQNNPYIQFNPYIQNNQLPFGLSPNPHNWLTQYRIASQYKYGSKHPFSLIAVALRTQMLKPRVYFNTRPRKILPKPVIKPDEDFQSLMEVPESEFVETKVYHLDRTEGVVSYKCKTCDTFIRKKTISKSRPKYGNTNPSNKCRICSKAFFTYKQLQSHLFRHSEKKLCCSYCSKKFLTKSEMSNHVNTHTGQKPYKCPACSSSFAQSSRYYSHIRDVHKKYHCDDCFRRSYKNNEKEK